MYVVFHLSDPAESDIPKYVGYGQHPSPWLALWQQNQGLDQRVKGWFESLRERDLKPVVLSQIKVVRLTDAEGLARFQIERIAEMAGTAPMLPDWLLNHRWWARLAAPRKSAKRVCRMRPDGNVERYPSIYAASRDSGSTRECIKRWCRSGCTCRDGCTWWFDYDE